MSALSGAGNSLFGALLNWRTYLPLFLIWIVLEDFVRKYSGNNILIYFVKDALALWLYLLFFLTGPHRMLRWPRTAFALPLILLFLITLVQAFNPALPDWRVAIIGLRNMFIYVPLLVVAYHYVRTPDDLRTLSRVIAVMAIIAALVGIGQVILGPTFLNPGDLGERYRFGGMRGGVLRTTSLFIDAGRFAYYLMFVFFYLLGAFIHALRTRAPRSERMLLAVALGLVMIATATGGSRTNIVAMMVATLITLFSVSPSRFFKLLIWLLLPGVLFAITDAERITTALGFIDSHVFDSDSWIKRTNHLFQAYENPQMLRHFWFGAGTGSSSQGTTFILREQFVGAPESGLAAIIMSYGIIAAPIWLWLHVAFVLFAYRNHARSRKTPLGEYTRAFLMLVFLYWLIINLLGYQGYENYIANALFWVFAGLGLRIAQLSAATPTPPPMPVIRPSALDAALPGSGR